MFIVVWFNAMRTEVKHHPSYTQASMDNNILTSFDIIDAVCLGG